MSGILSLTSFTIRTNSPHWGACITSVTSICGFPFASSIIVTSSFISSFSFSTNASTDGNSCSVINSSTEGNSSELSL